MEVTRDNWKGSLNSPNEDYVWLYAVDIQIHSWCAVPVGVSCDLQNLHLTLLEVNLDQGGNFGCFALHIQTMKDETIVVSSLCEMLL
jgi:hypothetical protein